MIVYHLKKGPDENSVYCSAESCPASNRGPLNPAGWLVGIILTGAHSSPSNLASIESKIVLCPEHGKKLEEFLKSLIGNLET